MDILAELAQHLLSGDDQKVSELTRQAIAAGLPPKQILDDGLIAGMTIVGERFKCHDLYLPDVLMAAQAMNAGLEHLKPLLVREGVPSLGKVVLGSVQGDLHDIGKNLVATMLEGAGFEVIDLGVDVSPEKFVDACRQRPVHVVGMSALLTTTMPMMAETIKLLRAQLQPPPKLMIGGAPVTDEYAAKIGADGYGRDAATGAELAKQLCRLGRN